MLPSVAMIRRAGPALVLLVIASCTCQSEALPTTKKEAGKAAKAEPLKTADRKDEPAPEPSKGPKFDASPPSTTAVAEQKGEDAKADPADPLGRRFADPAWFRKDMFDGAKAMDVSRSERNEQGLFSSQILFELPAGTSVESCADQAVAKVGKEVDNLARSNDEKAPGRIKIIGQTERYRVTRMCGEAKGVMRAYVSFEWLS